MIGWALKLMPAWAWRWLALAGLCAATVMAYNWWEARAEQRGYDRAEALWEAREAKIQLAAHERYSQELIIALKRSVELQDKVNEMTETRTAMEAQHAKDLSKAVADTRAGVERLRVPVRTGCPVPGTATQGAAANSSGPGPAQAELVPEFSGQLVSFAGAEARHVRDYNALLAYTRLIRAECLRPPGDRHDAEATTSRAGADAGPDLPKLPALPAK